MGAPRRSLALGQPRDTRLGSRASRSGRKEICVNCPACPVSDPGNTPAVSSVLGVSWRNKPWLRLGLLGPGHRPCEVGSVSEPLSGWQCCQAASSGQPREERWLDMGGASRGWPRPGGRDVEVHTQGLLHHPSQQAQLTGVGQWLLTPGLSFHDDHSLNLKGRERQGG